MTGLAKLRSGGGPRGRTAVRPLVGLALFAALVPAGCRSGVPDAPDEPVGWRAMYDEWEEPDPLPPFQLVDQAGREFSLARYEDAYVVVGFVFTRCPQPKACPLTMQRFREVQIAWTAAHEASKTQGKRLELLILTLDPEFDTPARLTQYGEAYQADFAGWTMATGPKDLLESAIPSLFAVLAVPTGEGNIAHTVKVAVLAPGLLHLRDWPDNEFSAADVLETVLGHQPATDGP